MTSLLDTEMECHECGATGTSAAGETFTVFGNGRFTLETGEGEGWTYARGDPVACIPAHWLCEECS